MLPNDFFTEQPKTIETLHRLFNKYEVPVFTSSIVNLVQIGKGGHSQVFKGQCVDPESEIDGKNVCIKVMTFYLDDHIVLNYGDIATLSPTNINDIIISNELSRLKFPTIQKIYGYFVNDIDNDNVEKKISLVKKYYSYTFGDFLQSEVFTSMIESKQLEMLSNLILHILFTIKVVFTNYFKGRFSDVSLTNILIKETKKEYISYGNKIMKVMGYIPILSDFGASSIIKLDKVTNKKQIIMRTIWRKDKKTMNNFNRYLKEYQNDNYDASYDIFVFFRNLTLNLKLSYKETITKCYIYLLKKSIQNRRVAITENFDLFDWKFYRSNFINIENLLMMKEINNLVTANLFNNVNSVSTQ